MKSLYTLAIVAALSLVSAHAGVIGSPKALEAAPRHAAGGPGARQSFEYRGGKGEFAKNAAVKGAAKDRDLVNEQRSVVYTGKNVRQNQFEIAPVK
jgi:hypothetical protein